MSKALRTSVAALVLTGLAALPAAADGHECTTTLSRGTLVGLPYASGQGNYLGGVAEPTSVRVGAYAVPSTPSEATYEMVHVTAKRTTRLIPVTPPPWSDLTAVDSAWVDPEGLEWTKQFARCMSRRQARLPSSA